MSVEELSNILSNFSLQESLTDSDSRIENNIDIDQESHLITNLTEQVTRLFEDNINSVTMSVRNTNVNPNVTNPAAAEVFKSEYLNCIPEFDGNPNELGRYLSVCESILTSFYDHARPDSFHNIYLLNSIISRLKGNARLVINIQDVTSWNELKIILTRNFADQRDETCLNRDLVLMKQLPNEKVQQFYDRVLNILNLLCSYVNCHETTDPAKQLKRELYQNLALKTFLSGLREPLGTTIRCMKPTSLAQAMQFVTQEDNALYFQTFSGKNSVKPPEIARNFSNENNVIGKHNWFPNANQRSHNPFPSQPIHLQPRHNIQQRFPTNIPAFRTPQQNRNVFRPNPQYRNFSNPTPMSGVSVQKRPNDHYSKPSTSHNPPIPSQFPQNNQKHYHNSRNHLVFEELNNTETNENFQTNEYQDYNDFNEEPYLLDNDVTDNLTYTNENLQENFQNVTLEEKTA